MTRAERVSERTAARVRELAARRSWAEIARTLAAEDEDRLRREPELSVHYADALWRVGQAERALAVAELVEPVLRDSGEQRLLLNLVNIRGIALFEVGRVDEAAEAFGELLELAGEWDDHEFAARAANNLGVYASVQDRYDMALAHYERALAAFIRSGNVRGVAQAHYNLGVNYRELGFLDQAESHYRLAISYATRAGSDEVVGLAESDRGLLRVQLGDAALGKIFAARARERFAALSDPVREGEALRVMGVAARATGEPAEALRCLDAALDLARRHGNRLLHAEVQRERGGLLLEQGDLEEARGALLEAVARFRELGAAGDVEAVEERLAELKGSSGA